MSYLLNVLAFKLDHDMNFKLLHVAGAAPGSAPELEVFGKLTKPKMCPYGCQSSIGKLSFFSLICQ